MKRLYATMMVVLAAAFAAPLPASATSAQCESLEVRIKSAGAGGGAPSAQARKYAQAIEAQKGQIGKAKAQLRALGCGTGSIITLGGSNRAGACGKLGTALRSMNANLSKLNAQYKRLSSGGGGGGGERRALQARYRALGCDNPDAGFTIAKAPRDTGIAALFGGGSRTTGAARPKDTRETKRDVKRERRKVVEELKIPGLDFAGDTFRTLCVRTCDGYYFPVSFSTTKENFPRDQKACESMCPGTEVKLFMHRVPEEESEDMASADGEPYKAMSYAFAYRRDGVSSDAACKCNAVNGMSIIAGGVAGPVAEAEGAAPQGAPLPTAKPGALLDRETMADAAGAFDDTALRGVLGVQSVRTPVEEDVRVVGPVFLPDPSGAINLKAPVRPLVR
jgi:hypothetical protein